MSPRRLPRPPDDSGGPATPPPARPLARPRELRRTKLDEEHLTARAAALESARNIGAVSVPSFEESPREPPCPSKVAASAPRRPPGVTDIDPRAPLAKGVRVRVLEGPFAGRTGVIQAFDPKGAARVALGGLLVHVERRDLVAIAEGRDRPALPSSHRRRPPAT